MANKTDVGYSKNRKTIYLYDEDQPNEKKKVYEINLKERTIIFYPNNNSKNKFFIDEINIKGFIKLPNEFSEQGYIKGSVLYYLNKKFSDKNVKHFTISISGKSSLLKDGYSRTLHLKYEDLQRLKDRLTNIKTASQQERSAYVDEFCHSVFPSYFSRKAETSKGRFKKVLQNLDIDIIQHIEAKDLRKIENFYEQLLKDKYDSLSHKFRLIQRTKIKVDTITIENVIAEFEKLLTNSTSESDWGKFLIKNLYLIDSKYVDCISEMNVVLAGSRKVDFGLIDSYGYLDIFEIKKPETKLLSKTKDRDNYYWSMDAVKAITQAEKYLYHAERKAPTLTDDIKRQKKINVKVIKPRAFLLLGRTEQLNNEEKEEDFRILRNSLKNIEIILYDELLERLKNQKNKIFSNT